MPPFIKPESKENRRVCVSARQQNRKHSINKASDPIRTKPPKHEIFHTTFSSLNEQKLSTTLNLIKQASPGLVKHLRLNYMHRGSNQMIANNINIVVKKIFVCTNSMDSLNKTSHCLQRQQPAEQHQTLLRRKTNNFNSRTVQNIVGN